MVELWLVLFSWDVSGGGRRKEGDELMGIFGYGKAFVGGCVGGGGAPLLLLMPLEPNYATI